MTETSPMGTTGKAVSKFEHLAWSDDEQFGNVAVAGNDSVETLKAVVEHVKHVHLKDIVREKSAGHETGVTAGTAVGDGEVDIRGCLDVLRAAGYEGCLSIECNGTEALKRSIEFLTPLL